MRQKRQVCDRIGSLKKQSRGTARPIALVIVLSSIFGSLSAPQAAVLETDPNAWVQVDVPFDPFMENLSIPANAATQGMWSAPFAWPMNGLHNMLLPDGKVLTFGTNSAGDVQDGRLFDIWDPSLGTGANSHNSSYQAQQQDSFCSSATYLNDGQLLVTGGNANNGGYGNGNTLFDPLNNTRQTASASTALPRWYATMIGLPDSRKIILGGMVPYTEGMVNNPDQAVASGYASMTPEIYENGQWRSLFGAYSRDAFGPDYLRTSYPHAFVAPNGQVFGISADKMWYLDPNANNNNGAITYVADFKRPYGNLADPVNVGALSVAVMYDVGKIIQVGGNGGHNGDGYPASNMATVVDINNGTPRLTEQPRMNYARRYGNGIVLANGDVVVTGGTTLGNFYAGSERDRGSQAVYAAEIWDPETGQWTLGASASTIRVYHSITSLLLNGSVLSTGGGTPGPVLNKTGEIYYPPYLFERNGGVSYLAARPLIAGISGLKYAHQARVQLDMQNDQPVSQLVLIGLSNGTHSFNSGQRRIPLSFEQESNRLSATIPNRNLTPPGYYQVVAVNANGVPSYGVVVAIGQEMAAPGVDTVPYDPTAELDSDNDGVSDSADAFPNDPSETRDSDGDGVGDNADAFPNDASEWADSDNDGIGDNQDPTPNGDDQPPSTVTRCAGEGGTCVLPGGISATVWYGANTNWAVQNNVSGSIACTNAVFGDPLFGTAKACYYNPDSEQPDDPLDTSAWVNYAGAASLATSYVSPWETLAAVNDGATPANSRDKSRGAYGNWRGEASYGATDWVSLSWATPRSLQAVEVYWWNDGQGIGTPNTAQVEYWDGQGWVAIGAMGTRLDQFNPLTFAPVTSSRVRVSMSSNLATGILEVRAWGSPQPPTVAMTAPTANALFDEGAAVTLSANAADADGTIARVAFFSGTTLLGEDTTSPYAISLPTLAAGEYRVFARATDNTGRTADSDAVDFVVKAVPPVETPLSNYAGTATLATSHVSPWETLAAVNDGATPANSRDNSRGAYGNWRGAENYGATDWVSLSWPSARSLEAVDVYWWNDGYGIGTPTAASVEYWDGQAWVSLGAIGTSLNQFNRLTFAPVITDSVRISMRSELATGILEINVWGRQAAAVATFDAPILLAGDLAEYAPQTLDGYEYRWQFGDGSASTGFSANAAASHLYAEPGVYLLTLEMRNQQGVVTRHSRLQAVAAVPSARQPASSTAMIYRSGNRLWTVNPDNDSVSVIDTASRTRLAEISVGTSPRSLAAAPDGQVWVVNKTSSSLTVVNPANLAVERQINLPRAAQPHGIVFAPDGSNAYITLEATGELLKLDPASGAIRARLALGQHVRHLAISADAARVLVARFITPPLPGESTLQVNTAGGGAEVLVVNTASMTLENTIRLAHSDLPDNSVQGSGLPNYLGAPVISPDGTTAWVPSKQDNIARGVARNGQALDFQNTVRAITSRINLLNQQESLAGRVDHDNASVASAAAYHTSGAYLFVALETSREVAVINAFSGAQVLRIPVGLAPQGLALSDDGNTLFVQNFMGRSVSVIDLSPLTEGGLTQATPVATVASVGSEKLSAAELRGKQLFYDAADDRLARDNYMSCASCHNDGGSDGRVWDFSGRGEGLRNTIALNGRAALGHGFLHWSANFDELQDFEGQIRSLAGGTGLMADGDFFAGTRSQPLGDAKAGVSADLDALAAYVQSLNRFAQSPYRNANGTLTNDAQAGRQIFINAGCASCHSGSGFTGSADGNAVVDAGTVKSTSGQRLGAALTGIDIPTLRDVWQTAPYLHDGSAPTLQAAVSAHAGGFLSADELDRLAAYLQQIGAEETNVP